MEFHEFLNQLPTRRTDSVARWLRKNRFKIKKNESSSSSSSDATILIDSPEDLPEGITSWEDLAKYRDNQNNNCDDIVFQCRINQRVQLKRKRKKSMEFCETRKSCPSCKGTKFNISLRLTIPLKTQPGCDILVALSSSKFRTQPIFNRNKILEMYETSWEFRQHWLEDVKSFVRLNFVSKRLKIFTGRVIRQKNDDQKKRAFLFCNDFEIV
ncbi:unnamed protein product [Caenorhabditis angaria]|uniref:Uncharacterized protein n=1 Tax=Caenorhabditis angaria TaxID=860376 RepID=A0A9P1IN60_9PELO|nr:unnamed protein product [Caenorhabditis angaria]